jgi:hypothetical protein
MRNQILKGVTLAVVLAYSGLAAAKTRAPDPELMVAIASQGNQALVTIRAESSVALVKPDAPAEFAAHQLVESTPTGGASAAATERCAQ